MYMFTVAGSYVHYIASYIFGLKFECFLLCTLKLIPTG